MTKVLINEQSVEQAARQIEVLEHIDLEGLEYDNQEELTEHEKKVKNLISEINAGLVTLSFSSLAAFKKSPKHFINYKLKTDEPTDSMIFGELVHCMVLEPDEVEDRYIIELEKEKRPGGGAKGVINFCKQVAKGVEPAIAYKNAYKNAPKTPEALTKKYEPLLFKYNDYIQWNKRYLKDFEAIERGDKYAKKIISRDGTMGYDNGLALRNEVWNNEASAPYIEQIQEVEMPVAWRDGGFDFYGKLDARGKHSKFGKYIFDLKKVVDASPRRFMSDIYWKGTHRQLGMYRHGGKLIGHDCLIIAVDNDGYVGVYPIDDDFIQLGLQEYFEQLKEFRRCKIQNLWHQGYEYYSANEYGTFYVEMPYWKQKKNF